MEAQWSPIFGLQVEYELQVDKEMLNWIKEMINDGMSQNEIANELSAILHTQHINVVNAMAEFSYTDELYALYEGDVGGN